METTVNNFHWFDKSLSFQKETVRYKSEFAASSWLIGLVQWELKQCLQICHVAVVYSSIIPHNSSCDWQQQAYSQTDNPLNYKLEMTWPSSGRTWKFNTANIKVYQWPWPWLQSGISKILFCMIHFLSLSLSLRVYCERCCINIFAWISWFLCLYLVFCPS